MAQYVYGCKNRNHPRVNVAHPMMREVDVYCEVCGERMVKIPQPFRYYLDPQGVLLDRLDREREAKHGK